ncbi:MAG: hypothetical protein NVSMB12_07540 [Acidimicrobiales bacterium]
MPGIEILAWFQITAVPAAGAPEAVRRLLPPSLAGRLFSEVDCFPER